MRSLRSYPITQRHPLCCIPPPVYLSLRVCVWCAVFGEQVDRPDYRRVLYRIAVHSVET